MICEECKQEKLAQKYEDVCNDCVIKIMTDYWNSTLGPIVKDLIKKTDRLTITK